MSFLKRLFGGGSSGEAASPEPGAPVKQVEHKGFTIGATPFKADGQYQTSGIVSKEIDGEVREHRFIRADRFPGLDDAIDTSIRKGIQIVNEQGERIFD
ncbi:MAG TPA: HlyU family transcriptional regulator [Mesorhizobium sp.]